VIKIIFARGEEKFVFWSAKSAKSAKSAGRGIVCWSAGLLSLLVEEIFAGRGYS
jgi:hypothetical protein